jgi:hypothetical protein
MATETLPSFMDNFRVNRIHDHVWFLDGKYGQFSRRAQRIIKVTGYLKNITNQKDNRVNQEIVCGSFSPRSLGGRRSQRLHLKISQVLP